MNKLINLAGWRKAHPSGYESVAIDISGFCNAKCKYCPAGNDLSQKGQFMEPETYKSLLEKLTEYGMITASTNLHVYCLGEPLLHPKLNEILNITRSMGLQTNISTNASIIPNLDHESKKAVKRVLISMPGFSQRSYDRIHGFNFEKIIKNIVELKSIFSESQFDMSYHIYQFNINEMDKARKFCEETNIKFAPNYAILMDKNKCLEYVNNQMPYEELKDISKELYLGILDYQISIAPHNYCDYKENFLSVTHKGDVRICSGFTRTYEANILCGNLFTDPADSIIEKLYTHPKCKTCMEAGLSCGTGYDCKVFPDSYYSLLKENEYLAAQIPNVNTRVCADELNLIHLIREWEQNHYDTTFFQTVILSIKKIKVSKSRLEELVNTYCRFTNKTFIILNTSLEDL